MLKWSEMILYNVSIVSPDESLRCTKIIDEDKNIE